MQCEYVMYNFLHIYMTETAAKDTLEHVMADALSKSGSTRSSVRAVCLAVSGVNHPSDQERILSWLRSAICAYHQLSHFP